MQWFHGTFPVAELTSVKKVTDHPDAPEMIRRLVDARQTSASTANSVRDVGLGPVEQVLNFWQRCQCGELTGLSHRVYSMKLGQSCR